MEEGVGEFVVWNRVWMLGGWGMGNIRGEGGRINGRIILGVMLGGKTVGSRRVGLGGVMDVGIFVWSMGGLFMFGRGLEVFGGYREVLIVLE